MIHRCLFVATNAHLLLLITRNVIHRLHLICSSIIHQLLLTASSNMIYRCLQLLLQMLSACNVLTWYVCLLMVW